MLLTCLSSDLGVGLKNENTAQLQCSQSTFSRKITFWSYFHGEKDRPSISIHQAAASVLATFSLAPCRRVYVPSVISQVILFPKLPGHCLTAWDSRIKCPRPQLLHIQENKLCARENTTAGSEKRTASVDSQFFWVILFRWKCFIDLMMLKLEIQTREALHHVNFW